jgi:hypothetical protein
MRRAFGRAIARCPSVLTVCPSIRLDRHSAFRASFKPVPVRDESEDCGNKLYPRRFAMLHQDVPNGEHGCMLKQDPC